MLSLSMHAAQRRKFYFSSTLLVTFVLMVLAAAPSIVPQWVPFLQPLTIDTDPENMLAEDEPVRVRHNELKKIFDIHDFVVVGVVNEEHPQGVFNPTDLANIQALTDKAKTLSYSLGAGEDAEEARVISEDIIAPSMVDNIETKSLGTVSFSWLMRTLPETDEEAAVIRDQALDIPMFKGTLVSDDGQSIMLYYPISHKTISHSVELDLRELIETFEDTGADYHFTGLPVAEDRFGAEMFFQMAVSAPLALLLVFLLLWVFFKHVRVILVSLLLAMLSVICTMTLLVISGQTVHIMSSMIPIFIIPIAVLDDIHILSDFYDRYTPNRNRFEIIKEVMSELWRPMVFTSLTTAAGFASLMLTPIPPVQVFGFFVAVGVLLAWFFTVTLRPAYFMTLSDEALQKFGALQNVKGEHPGQDQSLLGRFLRWAGPYAGHHAKPIVALFIVLIIWAGVGISKIEVNDNPIRWFEPSHEIRVADRIINEEFAGSYMAYLHFQPQDSEEFENSPFQQPQMLNYLSNMANTLEQEHDIIGKISGLDEIVKTVHRELFNEEEQYRIPDSSQGVAQTILTYENSHRPDDVWTFTTPDYSEATLWFQLKSGDNRDMERVEQVVSNYLQDNPPPIELKPEWFGLTYINLVWQEKMVVGMLNAFLGSLFVVLILTSLLFRSPSWGILAVLPLTITVTIIYGTVGWVGKDYDMPTAVLSSLSLGLAVDYAIHFLARMREIYHNKKDWEVTMAKMYEEPGRAITRNVIVVGVGFLPLIAAHLVPYQTVGILISAILILAGISSLVLLPALVTLLEKPLLTKEIERNES